jgi:hypothetical protein
MHEKTQVENHAMVRFPDPHPETVSPTERLEVLRYFPLRTGYVWTYVEQVVTATDIPLLQRQVTLTVHSQHGREYSAHWNFQSGHTRLPNVRYRVLKDGIQQAQLTGDTTYTPFVYILKAPLVVDATWRGLQGYPVRISAVALPCTVPAGVFDRCVETLQEIEPTPENRVLTRRRFAAGVGLVWQQRQLFQRENLLRTDTMELQKRPEPLRL